MVIDIAFQDNLLMHACDKLYIFVSVAMLTDPMLIAADRANQDPLPP